MVVAPDFMNIIISHIDYGYNYIHAPALGNLHRMNATTGIISCGTRPVATSNRRQTPNGGLSLPSR
jgi:hypothetical protein